MEDQFSYQTLTEDVSDKPVAKDDEVQNLRSEMISLAEKHEIKRSLY